MECRTTLAGTASHDIDHNGQSNNNYSRNNSQKKYHGLSLLFRLLRLELLVNHVF